MGRKTMGREEKSPLKGANNNIQPKKKRKNKNHKARYFYSRTNRW